LNLFFFALHHRPIFAVDNSTYGFALGPPFWRGLQVAVGSASLAALILIALLLWIFASAFSSASIDVLKRRAAISAWIGLPALLIYTLWIVVPGSLEKTTTMQVVVILSWTEVFAALFVGGTLRRRIFVGRRSPDPHSLPLATLIVSIISAGALYLFIQHGIIQRPSGCGSEPYSPLSFCGHLDREGFYVGGALFLVIVFFGIALPADSNLIRANDQLASIARHAVTRAPSAFESDRKQRGERIRQEDEERANSMEAEQDSGLADPTSYPVPAIVGATFVDAMRLKLRRSQRSSLMGKMLFALDARIELTAEERSLVEKYRLGDAVIYESTSRERHREAMKAHAESTRDQPGLFESPSAQLLGGR
jgi:hypothetical protein